MSLLNPWMWSKNHTRGLRFVHLNQPLKLLTLLISEGEVFNVLPL